MVPVGHGELPPQLELRARVTMRFREREVGFEVIARREPEALVMVGLSDGGTRLFALVQRGADLEIAAAEDARMAALARWTFDAVHRSYLITDRAASPAAAHPREGEVTHSFSWADELVTQRTGEDGALRGRAFRRRPEDLARPSATVLYTFVRPAAGHEDPPRRPIAEVSTSWCGYEAVLAPLDSPSPNRRSGQ